MMTALEAKWGKLASTLAGVLVLAPIYVLLEWLSSIHEYKGLPFTAWDPGLGLLFAVIVMRPLTGALALFAGIAAAEAIVLQSRLDWAHIFLIAAIVPASYWSVLRLVRRLTEFDASLARLRDVLVLFAAGAAGAILSAGLLIGALIVTGAFTAADILPAALPHFVGDVIGIAILTPLALKSLPLVKARAIEWPPGVLFDLLCYFAAIALFGILAGSSHTRESLQYFYVLFLPVVFAAVRHGLGGAMVALAATQAALVLILDWLDADASKFTDYQTLMLVLTVTGLLVGSIVSERDLARRRAQAMEWAAARAARFNLVSGMAAALSHEITQPLTVARARARIIQRLIETNDLDRIRENLPQLVTQIDRAADILQRMREFLRRGQPDRRPVSFDAVASGAQTLLAPVAHEKRVAIELVRSDNLPPILCDSVQIQQVLVNLASNAIDAIASTGQTDGRVAISAQLARDEHTLEVSVRDNGPGIDPSLAGSLFNAMTTTRPDGLGLGITICASIVESHQGRLWLESSRPGETEFRFRIPAAP